MSAIRTGILLTREAEVIAARLLDEAMSAANVSNEDAAESLGMSRASENVVRGMRAGVRGLTLARLLQLVVNRPTLGRALLARVVSWSGTYGVTALAELDALDVLVRALLDLVHAAYGVAADRLVTPEERAHLAPLVLRVRRALDAWEQAAGTSTPAHGLKAVSR